MKHRTIQKAMLGLLALIAVGLTACDEHQDYPDTSTKVGHILCTDGTVMTYEAYARSGKEAIGVVFYLSHDEDEEGYGYAVYLHDLSSAAFSDSLGVEQGTSADLSTYDGNSNTFALYASDNASSPMAQQVFELWRYGQSAYVPSVAQMRLLYAAKSDINPLLTLCGGEALPEDSDEVWYWTSTEVSGQQTAKAWLYSLGSGAIQETSKRQAHKVRPIVTLNN
jgi:hypothetical protein